MFVNVAKWQGNSFLRFWVIMGKPTEKGGEWGLGLKHVFLFDFRLSLIQEQIMKTNILSKKVLQKSVASFCRFCRGKVKTGQIY